MASTAGADTSAAAAPAEAPTAGRRGFPEIWTRGVCAIGPLYADGRLPVDGRPVVGTGFCFDTGAAAPAAADARLPLLSSAAHVWRSIEDMAVWSDTGKWSKKHDAYIYLWSWEKWDEDLKKDVTVETWEFTPPGPANQTGRLDPKLHGVAIGFEPLDDERARHGEIDWAGSASLCIPPGVLDPPLKGADVHDRSTVDSLDLVILQLRGVDPRLRTIQSFPLGDASLLNYTSEQVLVLGFGMPIGGFLLRPRWVMLGNLKRDGHDMLAARDIDGKFPVARRGVRERRERRL